MNQQYTLEISDKVYRNLADLLIKEMRIEVRSYLNGEKVYQLKWSHSKTATDLKKRSKNFIREFVDWLFHEIKSQNKLNLDSDDDRNNCNLFLMPSTVLLKELLFIFSNLLSRKNIFSVSQCVSYLDYIISHKCTSNLTLLDMPDWPIKKILSHLKNKEISKDQRTKILSHVKNFSKRKYYNYHINYYRKLTKDIQNTLFDEQENELSKELISRISGDNFGRKLKKYVNNISCNNTINVLWNAQNSDGAKPTNRYFSILEDALGNMSFNQRQQLIFDIISLALNTTLSKDIKGNFTTKILFQKNNTALLKGIVWLCPNYLNSEIVNALSMLERKCLAKIKEEGAGSLAVANAIMYVWKRIPYEEYDKFNHSAA